jgi:uncharacterized OB-fold protein
MKALYGQAFDKGKELASRLTARLPRPRLTRSEKTRQLPAKTRQKCPICGKENAAVAAFCQYCGGKLGQVKAGS